MSFQLKISVPVCKTTRYQYPRVKAYGQTRDHKKKRKKRETLAFETWEKLK